MRGTARAASKLPGDAAAELPADRARQRELDGIVSAAVAAAKAKAFIAHGDFHPLLEDAWCGTERGALQVRWTIGGTT